MSKGKVVPFRKPDEKMSRQQFIEYLIENKDNLIAYGSVDGNTIDGVFSGWKISESRYSLSQNYKVTWVRSDPDCVQNFYISDFQKLVEDGLITLRIVKS